MGKGIRSLRLPLERSLILSNGQPHHTSNQPVAISCWGDKKRMNDSLATNQPSVSRSGCGVLAPTNQDRPPSPCLRHKATSRSGCLTGRPNHLSNRVRIILGRLVLMVSCGTALVLDFVLSLCGCVRLAPTPKQRSRRAQTSSRRMNLPVRHGRKSTSQYGNLMTPTSPTYGLAVF
jgi:hypothetical protein